MTTTSSKAADVALRIGRWVLFTAVLAIVLRPVLTISLSYDDFFNPVRLRALMGANPVHVVGQTVHDLNDNGHFNYVGQSLGALAFVLWDQLMAMGVRYTTTYSLVKLVVFVAAITASAQLLRALLALVGRTWSPWRARLIVGVALVATMQLHVPWSFDPVGSFPFFGYLAVAVGFAATTLAVRILAGTSSLHPAWGAAALCLAILYYEINVAMVVALVPVGLVLLRHLDGAASRRALVRLAAVLMVPPTVMTVVLGLWARAANKGYEGTEAGLGAGGLGNVVRTLGSSLPAASWSTARDWLGSPLQLTVWASVGAVIVGGVLLVLVARPRPDERAVPFADAALLASSMVLVWLVSSLVQGVTEKVNGQSVGFGIVYMYYAYGSLALPMAAMLLAQAWRPGAWWRRWGLAVASSAAIVFVFVQLTTNDNAQRRFDAINPGLDRVLDAYADQPPDAERCAALAAFKASEWAGLYPSFPHDLDANYREHHGVAFCSEPGATNPP